MKARLIVNPVSGTDSAPARLKTINETLRKTFGDLDISLTAETGDAQRIAAKSVAENYTHIFVAGGDGTLNETLNGAASVESGLQKVIFGLIPLGTGNDFANSLGLTEDIEETLNLYARQETIAVDVGAVNEHFFVNVSAGGFIAEVSDAVNPQLKTIAGKFAYLLGGAQIFFEFLPFAAKINVRFASGETLLRIYNLQMFAVCSGKTIGGGNLIAPDAEIDDGLFDVCLFKADDESSLSFLTQLSQVPTGNHIGSESTEYFRARSIEFEFDREIKYNLDGEVFAAKSCRYRILPGAARFLAGTEIKEKV
jgi:diacylglycerol kinase (ATP)